MRIFWALIVSFFFFSFWSTAIAGDNPYAKRSSVLLPATLNTDRKATEALVNKSLSDLQAIYESLRQVADKSEEFVISGGGACACDVSHVNLLIIIAFAINKLDDGDRYQDWMEDESLRLLADYRELISACSKDAAMPAISSITDEMIKML